MAISIHALREEGDASRSGGTAQGRAISIHALREEGDCRWMPPPSTTPYFYPRPPRGGRQRLQSIIDSENIFLSTPSARRVTVVLVEHHVVPDISIHALREEGDLAPATRALVQRLISIHALREEGDEMTADWETKLLHFYPRPP